MGLWTALGNYITESSPLSYWLLAFIVGSLVFAVYTGYFRARKIQPNGFRWAIFRNEIFFAVINLAVAATVLGWLTHTLTANGIIAFKSEPPPWWVIGLEYAAYFFLFDTYFYWLHRWMHIEPMYKWIHKIHHKSTSPNLLTTLSVGPLESLINGGFVPLFTAAFTLHESTMLLIGPTNIIMGFYVHSGYEFLPRWWNKSWATKWFITTTFHDQHHKYFRWNFGGYTTIWDFLCGTVRSRYVEDYESRGAEKASAAPDRSPSAAMGRSPSAASAGAQERPPAVARQPSVAES